MALKRRLTDHEAYGLSQEERKLGERYLRKHKTAGVINEVDSLKLFELFLIGAGFRELHVQFPQFELGQIILTAAMRGWQHDRDKMMHSLKDRVRAKVMKSILEQVDFVTAMLSVSSAEHLQTMRQYVLDPENNAPPDLRVKSIKEYKDVVETLNKMISGSTTGSKTSSILDALSEDIENKNKPIENKKRQAKQLTAAQIIDAELDSDDK